MTSMRFSRANLSGVSACDNDDHRRAAQAGGHGSDSPRQGQAGQVVTLRDSIGGESDAVSFDSAGGGEFARQPWQQYFFLAPNVRFTRTPDSDKRPAAQPDDEASAKTAAPAGDSTRPAPTAAQTANPTRAVPSAASAVRPQQAITTSPRAVATPAQKPQPKFRWSYLSDDAFFEFSMPLLAERLARARLHDPAQPPVAPAPVRPAPAQPSPSRSASAGEAISFYRVIEWRSNGPAASPASVTAPAVAPAARPAPLETESRAPKASAAAPPSAAKSVRSAKSAPSLPLAGKVAPPAADAGYHLPSEDLLQMPPEGQGFYMSQERMEQNADLLESVLEDFGVKGEIIHVRPGPVVTLYEFEPAPGVKSSRVIGLADDIARSMSAISARVAVVPGRNVIGIELPNETRETVYFRELIESAGFRNTSCRLALGLGKTIGGEPVIADLAKMPHLLVAGTTGSGKSVAINTMILSLLYRMKPEECRLIMVDPKMLELSVYDGIPHLLTPVVTDSKKAVTALKWAVREMEERYRKMARLGVRNIDGYNQRAAAARDSGEVVVMQTQVGFEKGTGEPLFEEREIDLAPMPYIVIIVDEMADLMMVAGKEIEGAIQRLAQMARAAGIHLIMATQRPSVDVITGTIKANFPTRISFQVTSKIDSRTILGEQGAEQLLGQGDMLHMAGGGRIARVHGPFVSDLEVEHVVAHLKAQGRPEYLDTVTADEEAEEEAADTGPVFDKGAVDAEDGDALYEEAVKVVKRDKKCSTSYIQRRLGIGYNRAASLVERMEKEGLVGAPNHVGKREILTGRRDHAPERDETD
ncbi:DNA translocase FtsK [Mesorhizobium sp. WSM4884]|uniref:DNA translocase FtsK n=1 Tax=Mesorhizobium sp. WSM4884 TaxID=3038542 RepID=UPI002417D758|nr:DNA translocase FtsK [Mesorhizobium sp. WSM4884]MDG4884750.1 DNA translocase FtsK [Mesorhizobium sp. WSM4884]